MEINDEWDIIPEDWWKTNFESVDWDVKNPLFFQVQDHASEAAEELNPELVGCKCAEQVLKVYESVVGFDFDPWATLSNPPQTIDFQVPADAETHKQRWQSLMSELTNVDTPLYPSFTGFTFPFPKVKIQKDEQGFYSVATSIPPLLDSQVATRRKQKTKPKSTSKTRFIVDKLRRPLRETVSHSPSPSPPSEHGALRLSVSEDGIDDLEVYTPAADGDGWIGLQPKVDDLEDTKDLKARRARELFRALKRHRSNSSVSPSESTSTSTSSTSSMPSLSWSVSSASSSPSSSPTTNLKPADDNDGWIEGVATPPTKVTTRPKERKRQASGSSTTNNTNSNKKKGQSQGSIPYYHPSMPISGGVPLSLPYAYYHHPQQPPHLNPHAFPHLQHPHYVQHPSASSPATYYFPSAMYQPHHPIVQVPIPLVSVPVPVQIAGQVPVPVPVPVLGVPMSSYAHISQALPPQFNRNLHGHGNGHRGGGNSNAQQARGGHGHGRHPSAPFSSSSSSSGASVNANTDGAGQSSITSNLPAIPEAVAKALAEIEVAKAQEKAAGSSTQPQLVY